MPDDRPPLVPLARDRSRLVAGLSGDGPPPPPAASHSALAPDGPAARQVSVPLPQPTTTATFGKPAQQDEDKPLTYAPVGGASAQQQSEEGPRRVVREREPSAFAQPVGISQGGQDPNELLRAGFAPPPAAPVQRDAYGGGGDGGFDSFSEAGMSAGEARPADNDGSDEDEVSLSLKTCKTLRDVLQVIRPALMRDEMYLYVYRDSPKMHAQMRCDGTIGRYTGSDMGYAPSEEWFSETFGGGQYTISVEVVDVRQPPQADGRPGLRLRHKIKHSVPGFPNLSFLQPATAQSDMTNALPQNFLNTLVNSAMSNQGAAAKAEAAALPAVIGAINSAHQGAQQAERARAQDMTGLTLEMLREQREKADRLEREAREATLLAARQPADNGMAGIVQALIQNPIGAQDASRANELMMARISDMHRAAQEELRRKDEACADRIDAVRKESQMERDNLRRDNERAQELAEKKYRLDLEDIKGRYERQLNDAQRERENERLNNQRDRESAIKMLTDSYESRIRTIESISGLTEKQKDRELINARDETARLRAENDQLRARIFIPPQQAIREATELARSVGFRHESEIEQPPDENSMTAVAATIAKNAAPDMLKALAQFAMGGGVGGMGGGAPGGAPSVVKPPALPPAPPKTAAQPPQQQQQTPNPGPRAGRRARHQGVAPTQSVQGVSANGMPGPAVNVTGPAVYVHQPPPGVTPSVAFGADDPRAAGLANPRDGGGSGSNIIMQADEPQPLQSSGGDGGQGPEQEQGQVEQTGDQAIPPEVAARAEAFRQAFHPRGPEPQGVWGQIEGFVRNITMAKNNGMDPVALVRGNWQTVGGDMIALVNWVDPRNAALLCDYVLPDQGWDVALGEEWLAAAWATVEELATQPAG